MKKENENVRNWLLQAERFEDLAKFDSSDEAKKAFIEERMSYYSVEVNILMPEFNNHDCTIPDTNNPKVLKNFINDLIAIIKIQDRYIRYYASIIDIIKRR